MAPPRRTGATPQVWVPSSRARSARLAASSARPRSRLTSAQPCHVRGRSDPGRRRQPAHLAEVAAEEADGGSDREQGRGTGGRQHEQAGLDHGVRRDVRGGGGSRKSAGDPGRRDQRRGGPQQAGLDRIDGLAAERVEDRRQGDQQDHHEGFRNGSHQARRPHRPTLDRPAHKQTRGARAASTPCAPRRTALASLSPPRRFPPRLRR